MPPDIERAKAVIVEIVAESPLGIGKTKLFKTFWLAHLYYAQENPGFLSDWPVIRMPRGPAIDRAEELLGQLAAEGKLVRANQAVGPFIELRCSPVTGVESGLPTRMREAIRKAVQFAAGKTATELSEYSHEFSRSWRETPDGAELSIYTDYIPDEEFEPTRKALADARQTIADIFR